jgi:hypothetical protein
MAGLTLIYAPAGDGKTPEKSDKIRLQTMFKGKQ